MPSYYKSHPEYARKHRENAKNKRFGGNWKVALERENNQCARCSGTKRLHVHHIDGRGSQLPISEQNNVLENLITLCIKCHAQVEAAERKARGLAEPASIQGQWSRLYSECISCGQAKSKHASKGLCNRCYNILRRKYKREWRETKLKMERIG